MAEWSYGAAHGSESDVAAVQSIYDAFARRDLEAALAFVAPDVEFHLPETSGRAGRSGPYVGHAGMHEYFADLDRVWTDLTLHADDVRAAVGGVVVFGHVRGQIGGEAVHRDVVWTWKLRDGLATSVRASDLGRSR